MFAVHDIFSHNIFRLFKNFVAIVYFLTLRTSETLIFPATYNGTPLISDGEKESWLFLLDPLQCRPNKAREQKGKQRSAEKQAVEI